MALVKLLANLNKIGLCIMIATITVGLEGCTESKEDDPEIGCEFYSLWKSEYRMAVAPDGETVKVDVQVPKPFVYGTTHKLKGYDYLLNCPAFIEGHVLTYEYEPESFTYYSDDIVNLVPSADGNKYLLPNDDMIEAGVTTLDNATEFDYKWIHVSVAEDAVTIKVEPNDTGEYRNVTLLFLLEKKDYDLFNNVIEIMQLAKAG